MRKKPSSIDGFVPRHSGRSIGDIHKTSLGVFDRQTTIDHAGESHRPLAMPSEPLPKVDRSVSRKEIDASLKDIEGEDDRPRRRRGLFRRKTREPQGRRRKIVKRIMIVIILIVLVGVGYLGYSFLKNSMSIFKGNVFDIFQNQPLKEDANGRTNILIYGTSGSFKDQRHEGASLTDTLMVLSINQKKKNAFMFNIPRDFYVNYDTTNCSVGYQGKINAMHFCYTGGATDEASDIKGARALQKKFKEITGLTFQYYAHINWAVVTSAVNAVGGIDVDVKGNGSCALWGMPEGSIVDNNMKIRYTPGRHHMNGEQALKFSRARGAAGACGLDQGDFDRQMNQQKVLKALQEKAISAGTLTNLGKVTGLMDAMGQNLRTNFEMSEVRTLMSLGKDIPSSKVTSINLVDQANPLITSGNIPGAGSTQVPRAGTYEYSEIKAFLNKKLNANEVSREDAHVALFNASGVEGFASKQSERLGKQGFNITAVDNAPAGKYSQVEVYDLTNKNPATKKKLASIYNTKVIADRPSITVTGDTDFIVIFGKATSTD
ncbi:MAG TPA: LCP family protein [Candidatus Saccharimonadales bacterium]